MDLPSDRNDDTDAGLAEAASSTLHISQRRTTSLRRERRLSDINRPQHPEPDPVPSTLTPSFPTNGHSRWRPRRVEVSHFFTPKDSKMPSKPSPSWRMLKHHECKQAVCAILKVFETTELLELILSFIYVDFLLPLRAVNRSWHQLIAESPLLRQRLFVHPAWQRPATDFDLLQVSLRGLTIKRGKPIHRGHWIEVHISLEAANAITRDTPVVRIRSRSIFEGLRGGLGRRRSNNEDTWPRPRRRSSITESVSVVPEYKDLYVSQPPLVGMQAFIVDSGADQQAIAGDCQVSTNDDDFVDSASPPACAKLSCDAGITLGFLAETTQSLLRGRKDNADEGSSKKPDNVVVFKAIMSFCQTDTAPRKRSTARSVTTIA